MTQDANLNDIHIVRVYDAPVKAVWDAWTDPNQLAKWWGPRGFTITTHSKDFRVGGHWKLTMHGPDGNNVPNYIKYIEVGTHSKLIYDHGGVKEQPPMFRVSVVFTESNGKTQMDMIMTLPTPEAAAETTKNIKKFDGYSTWDRLAEYLAHELTGKNQFVINRVLDAPLELMYEMWTNPKHFENWLPPTGATMEFIRADIRAGGNSFYCMSAPGDVKIYGRAQYIETKNQIALFIPSNLLIRTSECPAIHLPRPGLRRCLRRSRSRMRV